MRAALRDVSAHSAQGHTFGAFHRVKTDTLSARRVVAAHPPGGAAQHVRGGRGGKECAARHERSNDWPRGAAGPLTRSKAEQRGN